MRKVIIAVDGRIQNIIEIEPDEDGGFGHWPVPDACTMIDDGLGAEPGGRWDGSQFIAPVVLDPSRLDVLMAEGPATQVYNQETETMVDRPADDIAADKSELLGLLQTRVSDTEDLTWEQMNKMLALERES